MTFHDYIILGYAKLTGTVRYCPDFEWSTTSLVYNLFRAYELLFGRQYGIRAEASARVDGSIVIRQYRSVEAALTFFEEYLRGLIPKPIKVWVPVFTTPNGLPMPASPYLFAIAFDTSDNPAGGTTGSPSYTVTGSDPLIMATISGDATVTFTDPTCSYNNVSLTRLIGQDTGSVLNYGQTIHGLAGPATGSNTFSFASNDTDEIRVLIASYSGVSQTGLPDATNQAIPASPSTGATASITTVASDCWILYGVYTNGGNIAVTAGATLREQPPSRTDSWMGDTNGAVSAGSNSATFTWNSSTNEGWQAASFAPPAAAGPTNLKSLDGNVKANIKIYNGNLLANIKSINSNV